jgi:dihydropteroate synthase
MGILNLTPDSFSGDGVHDDVGRALENAERLVTEGADIIDVGGESTRPGSAPVELEEEINRVIPVVERLAKNIKTPISIDTRKAEVARRALDSGATMINDITGLDSDINMREIAVRYDAGVVIMHIKGEPMIMQQNPDYDSLMNEIIERLLYLVERAEECGVKEENIIIDPGIGFGKRFEHNLEILNMLSRFKVLGKPILVGPSRKSFIGDILGVEPKERIFGTAASVAIAIRNGADIIRVHDVKQMKQVAMVTDAIVRSGETINA